MKIRTYHFTFQDPSYPSTASSLGSIKLPSSSTPSAYATCAQIPKDFRRSYVGKVLL